MEKYNVIDTACELLNELGDYYKTSKNQMKGGFWLVVGSCVAGIFAYAFGIVSVLEFDKDISVLSAISGTTLEILSGTTFWLYKKTVAQLNLFHDSLEELQKYMVVYQIAQEVPEEKKYEEQRNLINYILNNGQRNLDIKHNDCDIK